MWQRYLTAGLLLGTEMGEAGDIYAKSWSQFSEVRKVLSQCLSILALML